MTRNYARGALRRIKMSAQIGMPDLLGYPRWALRTGFGRRPPAYRHRSVASGALDYSRNAFRHYHPQDRIRWPLYLLASIPGNTRGDLLILGPRFESELVLAAGLGWQPDRIHALDLLAYSPRVAVGDMHDMPFQDSSIDSLICGWTISYSQSPARLADEIRRVIKPRGIVVFGIEVAGPTSPLLPDIPHGADRIQTSGQVVELLPGFDVIASFEPDGPGNLIVALRRAA